MKSWYEIKNKSNNVLDVSIHDEIGYWGVTATEFINDLNSNKDYKSINLSIHSPGGDMLDGFAIYNALITNKANVYANVLGIAASAASMILMAGNTISIPEDAFIMIHNPYGVAVGGSDEMRDYADIMDKLSNSAVNIYEKKTGLQREEIIQMLDAETWMNGTEAVEKGFADTITEPLGVAAKASGFDKHFKKMPVNSSSNIEEIETIKEFERYLRDSGSISRANATKLASRAKVIFQSESELSQDAELLEIKSALMRFKIPS